MGLSQIGGTTASRLVTKANTAGQQNLNSSAALTSVAAGNTSWGSWIQITASTSAEFYITAISAYRLSVNTGGDANSVFQIGIGGSGSETVVSEVGSSLTYSNSSTFGATGYMVLPVLVRVAAGQRVTVRAQSLPGTAPTFSVAVYGVPYANVEGN